MTGLTCSSCGKTHVSISLTQEVTDASLLNGVTHFLAIRRPRLGSGKFQTKTNKQSKWFCV